MQRIAVGVFGGLLLAVALMARLSLIHTSHFMFDEASLFQTATEMREGHAFPLLGPIISGGEARHPGPLAYYIVAASQLVSPTPEAANAFVAILGALAAWIFWLALRPDFGECPAAFAALLFACSPWVTLFADRIWDPNYLGFLSAVALWAALKVRRQPGSPAMALLIVATAVMPQLHLSTPILWVGFAALIYRGWRRSSPRWVTLGVVGAVFLYLPGIWHELTTGAGNLRMFLAENHHSAWRPGCLRVLPYAFRLLTLDVTYQELCGYWNRYSEWTAIKALFQTTPAHSFHWLRCLAVLSSFGLAGWAYVVTFSQRGPAHDPDLGDFRRAIVWSVAATFLLLAVKGNPWYGHYEQCLVIFLFVAYAFLARSALMSSRATRVLLVLGGVFCVGGIEAAWSISHHIDAVNGLTTEREVLETILADRARLMLPDSTPVELTSRFRVDPYAYAVLAKSQYHTHISFSSPAALRYRIEGEPLVVIPADAAEVWHLGRVALVRLKP